MRVLVLAPALYDTSPGQRFRMEQWARHLEGDGFEFTFAGFEDEALHRVLYERGRVLRKAALLTGAFGRRLRLLPRVRDYDLVYVFREAALAGPALVERLIARTGVPLVFDFDDAVWVPYVSPANHYLSYLKCFGKTATLCRISRHVLAGNPYLAAYAGRHSANVSIVPTTIDTEVYRVRPDGPPAPGAPVTVGWTGSYSTVQHLDLLRPVFAELRRRVPFRLVVIGTPDYRVDGVETVARPWRAASEVEELQQFDVGIMPLPDDDWSRGKCGLKLLQCMAVGAPVVGSPVGVNTDIIQDGENGFLAGTEEEWLDKLGRLIRSAALRKELGERGRRTVEDRYSARHWAPRVGEILASAARTGQPRRSPAPPASAVTQDG